MFDEHTLIFVASKIEISYKAKKGLPIHLSMKRKSSPCSIQLNPAD
jgi:hypothetical protein